MLHNKQQDSSPSDLSIGVWCEALIGDNIYTHARGSLTSFIATVFGASEYDLFADKDQRERWIKRENPAVAIPS